MEAREQWAFEMTQTAVMGTSLAVEAQATATAQAHATVQAQNATRTAISEQATATAQSSIAGGIGQTIKGSGDGIAAGLNFMAEMARAEQKEMEADQKVHETHAQDETEWMQNMLDVIRDTRQKLEEVIRARQDTMKSVVRA